MTTRCPRCGKTFRGQTVGKHVNHCPVTWQELYWNKVDKNGPGGCWLWTGALEGKGYGHCRHGKVDHRAHHVSWEMATGNGVPKGMSLMHSCDVRNCVNPAHLSVGTHHENMIDCMTKRRHVHGERNSHAKLTEEQVRQIRALYKKSGPRKGNGTAVAAQFGVGVGAIHAIGRRSTWKYVK